MVCDDKKRIVVHNSLEQHDFYENMQVVLYQRSGVPMFTSSLSHM